MSKDTQVVKAKPAEDQSWSGWKQYFADGFKYMREESWQLAVDAKREGWNILVDLKCNYLMLIWLKLISVNLKCFSANTGNIAYDVYMADKYKTTPHPNQAANEGSEEKTGEVFSVEKFHRQEENQSAILKEDTGMISMSNLDTTVEKSDLPPMQ